MDAARGGIAGVVGARVLVVAPDRTQADALAPGALAAEGAGIPVIAEERVVGVDAPGGGVARVRGAVVPVVAVLGFPSTCSAETFFLEFALVPVVAVERRTSLADACLAHVAHGARVVVGAGLRVRRVDAAGRGVAGVVGARVQVIARLERGAGLAVSRLAHVAQGASIPVVAKEVVVGVSATRGGFAGVLGAHVLVVARGRATRHASPPRFADVDRARVAVVALCVVGHAVTSQLSRIADVVLSAIDPVVAGVRVRGEHAARGRVAVVVGAKFCIVTEAGELGGVGAAGGGVAEVECARVPVTALAVQAFWRLSHLDLGVDIPGIGDVFVGRAVDVGVRRGDLGVGIWRVGRRNESVVGRTVRSLKGVCLGIRIGLSRAVGDLRPRLLALICITDQAGVVRVFVPGLPSAEGDQTPARRHRVLADDLSVCPAVFRRTGLGRCFGSVIAPGPSLVHAASALVEVLVAELAVDAVDAAWRDALGHAHAVVAGLGSVAEEGIVAVVVVLALGRDARRVTTDVRGALGVAPGHAGDVDGGVHADFVGAAEEGEIEDEENDEVDEALHGKLRVSNQGHYSGVELECNFVSEPYVHCPGFCKPKNLIYKNQGR